MPGRQLQHRANAGPLDYGIDFVDLIDDGDTLSSVSWDVPDGTGLTHHTTGGYEDTVTGTVGLLWLSGGTIGETVRITGTATTAGGRFPVDWFEILVVD